MPWQVQGSRRNPEGTIRSVIIISFTRLIESRRGSAPDDDGHAMEIYRIAGKKAAVLLDPFEIPAKAILTGVQLDRGGQMTLMILCMYISVLL